MYLQDHSGSAFGGQSKPSITTPDELYREIKAYIRHTYGMSGGENPFVLEREGNDLNISLNRQTRVTIIRNDAKPGEFMVLESYNNAAPPLTDGPPDNDFFVRLHCILDCALKNKPLSAEQQMPEPTAKDLEDIFKGLDLKDLRL